MTQIAQFNIPFQETFNSAAIVNCTCEKWEIIWRDSFQRNSSPRKRCTIPVEIAMKYEHLCAYNFRKNVIFKLILHVMMSFTFFKGNSRDKNFICNAMRCHFPTRSTEALFPPLGSVMTGGNLFCLLRSHFLYRKQSSL